MFALHRAATLLSAAAVLGCNSDSRHEALAPLSPSFDALTGSSGQAGTIRVIGGGESTAIPFVTWIGHDENLRNIPSIGVVGDRFTFGFTASKDPNGTVRGQLQLVDHTLGMVIHGDVVTLVDHPIHERPVGSSPGRPNGKRLRGSTGGVVMNGQPLAGWRLDNSPVYDGGSQASGTGDVVCFELFNASGVLVKEWIGFVTSGEVRIEE